MGERDFKARYRDNKREADSAARSLENGEIIEGWRYEPAWPVGQLIPKSFTRETQAFC